MKKHHTAIMLGVIAVILYLLWKYYKGQSLTSPAGANFPYSPFGSGLPQLDKNFLVPYSGTTPGYEDNSVTYNGPGGQPFASTINVNVTPNVFGSLTNNYIPLYGFVGMAA